LVAKSRVKHRIYWIWWYYLPPFDRRSHHLDTITPFLIWSLGL